VAPGSDGGMTLKTRAKILERHGDPFAAECGL